MRNMLDLLPRMKYGNVRQRRAYHAIDELNIMNDFHAFHPIVCGTIPITLDTENSDLDIIMEVHLLKEFEEKLWFLYGNLDHFQLKRTFIRGMEVRKAKFVFRDFLFEIFGQSKPTYLQNAYLHMVIEHKLMEEDDSIKKRVMKLKQQGYKTEPAFCKVLGIKGDPYEGLIRYGLQRELITLDC